MADDFEDHCWKNLVPAEVLSIYSHYRRDIFVGPRPALLAIDLYDLVYQGGPRPVAELVADYPSACGLGAWDAIEPTVRVFQAARRAGIPIFYTTGDARAGSKPNQVMATRRQSSAPTAEDFSIREEFKPLPGDVVITKQRASAFYGTPLTAHLTELGVHSLIIVGESTSGCVRASAVDGYSHGYHVSIAEECCFDRSELSHKISLFDLHHKYADVMKTAQVVAHLDTLAPR